MTYAFTADCTACGACLLTCPEHAIVAGLPLRVREDRCTSCGECVEVCPADAILEMPADHEVVARPHAHGTCHQSMISAEAVGR
ncbi:MAG: 4Fe-4S binding protein [Frankiales bacterium]|nr:4Fe-4S binding protein [Frankiales bacterium]